MMFWTTQGTKHTKGIRVLGPLRALSTLRVIRVLGPLRALSTLRVIRVLGPLRALRALRKLSLHEAQGIYKILTYLLGYSLG